MSTPIATCPLIMDHGKFRSKNIITQASNLLSGKIFEHWKEPFLISMTVYCVIRAVFSFFSGYWLISLVEISAAAMMRNLAKEVRDFTDFRKNNRDAFDNNMKFAQNLLAQRAYLSTFKTEVENLRQESQKLKDSNVEYKGLNQEHALLLGTLGETTSRLGTEITQVIERGGELSRDILEKFLESVKRFESQKGSLNALRVALKDQSNETFERFEKLTLQVGEMSTNGVQLLNDANTRLHNITEEIKAAEVRATSLKETVEKLKTECAHLERIRRQIQTTVDQLKDAANTNTQSANMVANMFKYLFGQSNSDGPGFLGLILSISLITYLWKSH